MRIQTQLYVYMYANVHMFVCTRTSPKEPLHESSLSLFSQERERYPFFVQAEENAAER